MTTLSAAASFTPALIESTIEALPIQGRIMLKLILLQHFDVTDEEINYMTADRPDPRCVTGTKPTHDILTQEAIKAVRDKRDQYRRQVRLKRERTWLQCECLRDLLRLREALADRAADLLRTKFAASSDTVEELRSLARTAVSKPQIRALDQRWEAGELSVEDYQRQRLGIEMQTQLRFADRYRKRLDQAVKERQIADHAPLQDHEICHIWGIPAGSLAARKVKYLAQYLQALHTALQGHQSPASTAPVDLWRETFTVLATRPVERSLWSYDGLERTEANLIEKLTMMAWGTLAEDVETKFWLSLVQGGSSNAVHPEVTRSLFGLQRLGAILKDLDTSPESLEEVLMARVTPKAREEQATLEAKPAEPESNEMKEHVLRSMFGEHHPDLAGGGKWG
ncbi:MAG TPA: hypothetical protein VFS39_03555 [Nitrospira sp.]|nr:hypothetical protein [Nitrospira sp.]